MFNPETGKIIHLTHGAGNGVDTACLMTASNMLCGRGADGDYNSCVCLVIRSFIITTNDAMPEALLGELYGPLAWEILGTRTDDPSVERQRAYRFSDWAVREVAPIALDAKGLHEQAAKLRGLEPVVDQPTAADAGNAANAASYAADAGNAANAAYAGNAANAAAHAACAAAYAAYAGADAAYAGADAETIWRKCPDIIREVAAIGDRRPVETVIGHDELADALAN